jgi:hypothetical protein
MFLSKNRGMENKIKRAQRFGDSFSILSDGLRYERVALQSATIDSFFLILFHGGLFRAIAVSAIPART